MRRRPDESSTRRIKRSRTGRKVREGGQGRAGAGAGPGTYRTYRNAFKARMGKKNLLLATGKHRMRKACGNEDVIPRRIPDGSGCPSWRAHYSRFEKEKLFSWLCSSHAMLGHTQVLASPRYQVTQNTLTSTMLNAQRSNVSISNVQYQHIFFFTRNPKIQKLHARSKNYGIQTNIEKIPNPEKNVATFFGPTIKRSNAPIRMLAENRGIKIEKEKGRGVVYPRL